MEIFWAGFIETWGRGIEKICAACREYDIPDPVYTIYPEDIMVMFKAKKSPNKVTDKQKYIIQQIETNPNITTRELSQIVGISQRKIKENLQKLKDKGFLRRIGPAKGGYWEIIK